MTIGRVVSVNVGALRVVTNQGKSELTGIFKEPVSGRIATHGVNLDGDDQGDREVHGGPDKAIYSYAVEDYDYWRSLGRHVAPGMFGENLTLSGLDLTNAIIGETWRAGTMLVQVVQPRLPCWKLAQKMQDPAFVRTFTKERRPGAYLRILEHGEVGAGDTVEVLSRPDHGVTIAMVNEARVGDGKLAPLVAIAPELPANLKKYVAEHPDA